MLYSLTKHYEITNAIHSPCDNWGLQGYTLFNFLIFALIHRLWVLVRGGSNAIYIYRKEKKRITIMNFSFENYFYSRGKLLKICDGLDIN